MATPKKKPNGKWEVNIYLGTDSSGKRRQKKLTGSTRTEVLAMMKDYENADADTYRLRKMTVGEAVDRYIERSRRNCSPSTIPGYRKAKTAFAELMPMRIDRLTDRVCQDAIDRYAKERQPKTVVNRWNVVATAVRQAGLRREISVTLPQVRRKRLEVPEEADIRILYKAVEGTPLEIPVLLASVCGLRRSEICALDLERDIDYERGMIQIKNALVINESGEYVVKGTKSYAGARAVPCPAWVLAKLAEARDDPERLTYAANTITTKFRKVARSCNFELTFHGLRHYYASVMSALGVPEQYQMERMGHSTNYMLKRYQEYIKSKEASVNEEMMRYFDRFGETMPSADRADREKD